MGWPYSRDTHENLQPGIGFKSVFLVSALPHVFSNGYQIRFSEIPNLDCAIGYIVPEWVSTKPSYSDIQAIYGSGKALPNTVIILPLKPEKVEVVKKQLSEIHPEVFPIKANNMVDARKDIKEWVISLAFPSGGQFSPVKRGTSSTGVFAFLPTAMVSNFPFIIQTDFILSSSREIILLENKWNSGILDHVPHSFCSAFTTFMKSTLSKKYFSVGQVLHLLPCLECSYKELNRVRQFIMTLLEEECIVPCETFVDEKIHFCVPTYMIRVLPEFRKILVSIKEHSVLSRGISSWVNFVVHNSVDRNEYDDAFDFLRIPSAGTCNDWFNSPTQCFLCDGTGISTLLEIERTLEVLSAVDEEYYMDRIRSFKDELIFIGMRIGSEDMYQLISNHLKHLASSAMCKTLAILLLSFIKYSNDQNKLDEDLLKTVKSGKWLKTNQGYLTPPGTVYLIPDMDHLLNIVPLPVVDKEYYGSRIGSYRAELEAIGVVVDLDGAYKILSFTLKSTLSSSGLTSANVFSLLNCIRPFIDEKFYVTLSSLEKEDLKAIGVKVDIEEACNLISHALTSHIQTSAVRRIHRFLYKFNWNPQVQDTRSSQLWILDQQVGKGKWVENWRCVLHDQDNLFDARLHAPDKYYEKELLPFLSRAFGVREVLSSFDYIDIWNDCEVTQKFPQKTVQQATCSSAANTSRVVQFVTKEVFIADDLKLKQSFTEASEKPLFVWFPPRCSSSPDKLLEIYTSLGVQKISEAVQFDLHCTMSVSEKIDKTDSVIGKALIKLVLAFAEMPMEEKHKIANSLLELSVYGTECPISVRYALQLPLQKRRLEVEIEKMVLWEKNSQRLLVKKSTWNEAKKDLEFIASFARAISEAVLPYSRDQKNKLCKIIQMGLEEDAGDYLLWTENLELSVEDKEFLDRLFPSGKSSPVLGKRQSINPLLP
uniref:Sacsin n=1 Tax=Quercus lobata TaxID=97700 RepID=A0A7N2MZP0_QUELO